MLKNLYIQQFRCFQNFEVRFEDIRTALIIGRNGSGKTALLDAVEILQQIGRGKTQVAGLIGKDDFAFGDSSHPMSFKISVELDQSTYVYSLELEYPSGFREPRVSHESLTVDARTVFVRDGGSTALYEKAEFTLDWHHIGLPLVFVKSEQDPIAQFRRWLGNIIILSPTPSCFVATSSQKTSQLHRRGVNLLDWIGQRLGNAPHLYSEMADFLVLRMPDFRVFRFDQLAAEQRQLVFEFQAEQETALELNFSQLSDGEKIYVLAAALLGALGSDQNTLCLWDEGDSFISLPELGHFIAACRKGFENSRSQSQLILTSHNAGVINEFSSHNTLILSRDYHRQPSRSEWLATKQYLSPSVVEAYDNGELD